MRSTHAGADGNLNRSDGGHHTSLVRWGLALDCWDEFAPALAMLNQAAAPGSTRHERARLSLALGHPRQGLDILDEDRSGSLAGRSAADAALRAALRAALGDHDAYAWLRSQVVRDTGSAPIGYLRWLLAVAAEGAGDRPAADALWVSLVEQSHLLTWHSAARYNSIQAQRALLAANRGGSWQESAGTYLNLVGNLERLPNPLDRDARPILDAVRILASRGESRAAVLLLTAAAHAGPPNPVVRREFERRAPRTLTVNTRWLGAMISATGLVSVVLGRGLVGMVIATVAAMGWMHWVPIRGWTRTETRIFRTLHAMRFDPVTRGPARGARDLVDRRLFWGLVGLAVGLLVAGPLVMAAVLSTTWATHVGFSPWLLTAVVCGVLGHQWGLRTSRGARSPRAVSHLLPPDCQCATTEMFAGAEADNYARRHLVCGATESAGPRATVLTCPTVGVPWLLTVVTDGGGTYLLRGEATVEESGPPGDRQPVHDPAAHRRAEMLSSSGADASAPELVDHASLRATLARGMSCPEKVLVELSRDPETAVRAAVAGNPHCPEAVLLELFADHEMDVWTAAKNNPSWPPDWPVDDPCAARGIDPPRAPLTLRTVVIGTRTLVQCTEGQPDWFDLSDPPPDTTTVCRADAAVLGIWGSFCLHHRPTADSHPGRGDGAGYLAERHASGIWVALDWDGPCSPAHQLWQ